MKLLNWLTEPNPDSRDAEGRALIAAIVIVSIVSLLSMIL
jgi:hypothetical protein